MRGHLRAIASRRVSIDAGARFHDQRRGISGDPVLIGQRDPYVEDVREHSCREVDRPRCGRRGPRCDRIETVHRRESRMRGQ